MLERRYILHLLNVIHIAESREQQTKTSAVDIYYITSFCPKCKELVEHLHLRKCPVS